MKEKIARFKLQFFLVVLVELLVSLLVFLFFGVAFLWLPLLIIIVSTGLTIYYMYLVDMDREQSVMNISRILGNDAKNSLIYGGVGLVAYDEENIITWMSDIFEDYQAELLNTKITEWDQSLRKMFQDNLEQTILEYQDIIYEVVRQPANNLLFFKDITKLDYYQTVYQNEKLVLGLIHLDNYEEVTQYEDEQIVNYIDTQVRQPVVSWALDNGIIIKRIKSDRYLLVLNEMIFNQIREASFNIVAEIRQKSQQSDLPITISMVFARESEDLNELEESLNRLLELAQSRGGDQVAYRKLGKEVKYFGGRSEALEKRSRVRVRVMSNTLRDLIVASDQIFIVGHRLLDFDSFGSALGMSRLAQNYQKPTYILYNPLDTETKLAKTVESYQTVIDKYHILTTEEAALANFTPDSLLIMVDHHSEEQTSSAALLKEAERIVVIDHHRRSTDFTFEPLMVYVEASASSVCELITEFFPYQNRHITLTAEEATMMMAGVVIDTLNFKKRTGSRTFEAASLLKRYGADLTVVEEILKDDFSEVQLKNKVITKAKVDYPGIIIAPYPEVISRTMLSIVADELLEIQGINASFTIGQLDDSQVGISARSSGKINVQVIMEEMSGGGHFTAAALQKAGTVKEVYRELKDVIEAYFKEEENESNLT